MVRFGKAEALISFSLAEELEDCQSTDLLQRSLEVETPELRRHLGPQNPDTGRSRVYSGFVHAHLCLFCATMRMPSFGCVSLDPRTCAFKRSRISLLHLRATTNVQQFFVSVIRLHVSSTFVAPIPPLFLRPMSSRLKSSPMF